MLAHPTSASRNEHTVIGGDEHAKIPVCDPHFQQIGLSAITAILKMRYRNFTRTVCVCAGMNTEQIGQDRSLVGPLMMILAGVIFPVNQFVPELGFDKLWPLLLIAGGIAALYGRR